MSMAPLNLTHRCRGLAIVAAACLALSSSPVPAQSLTVDSASANARFDEALAAYERNHWQDAYRQLVQLADQRHPEAARMALDMWRWGVRLYGHAFYATAIQVQHWSRLWGCGGDATGPECQLVLQANLVEPERDQ